MRAELRRADVTGEIHVYVYEPSGLGQTTRVLRIESGMLVWTELENGSTIDPREHALLTVPVEVFDLIVREARHGGTADDLAIDAIQDARATRDRLLSIVEGIQP